MACVFWGARMLQKRGILEELDNVTTLLQPDMRTVSVIPDPTELNFLSYPVPLDLVCEIFVCTRTP